MAMTGISSFICCYNHGEFIRHAFDSLMKQTWKPEEVILLNDASTDETQVVMEDLAKDARVQLITHDTRQGNIKSYNECISTCTKEFIHLMAADDFLLNEHFYEDAIGLMRPGVGFVSGGLIWVDRDGERLSQRAWAPVDCCGLPPRITILRHLKSGNFINGGCTLVRRQAYASVPPYSEDHPLSADYLMWVRMLDRGWRGGFICGDVYAYRRHTNQLTHERTADQRERSTIATELFRATQRLEDVLKSHPAEA